MNIEHTRIAEFLRALGHAIRYCIVEGLLSEEQNVASMVQCTCVPQPTVSQHLNILKAAGVLKVHREGNQMLFSVCCEEARHIICALK